MADAETDPDLLIDFRKVSLRRGGRSPELTKVLRERREVLGARDLVLERLAEAIRVLRTLVRCRFD